MKRERLQGPHYLYRIFDAEGALIYVGATSALEQRMTQHRHTHRWPGGHPVLSVGDRMAAWVAEEYPTRRAAFDAERAVIAAERPELNTANNNGFIPESTKENVVTLEPAYNLSEIAEAVRMSTRWVRDQIKAGMEGDGPFIEHQRNGKKITMTAAQVDKLRAVHTQTAPVAESITTGRRRRAS